jgi:hypothetical protein
MKTSNKHIGYVLICLAVSVLYVLAFTSGSFAAMPNYQWAGSISGLTPTSVTVDSDRNIYVTEASYDRLRKYSKSGVLLHTMTNLDMPKGVAVDSSGKIYIGCEDTSVVEVYSPGFTLLYKLGDPDDSGSPTYIPQPNSIDIDAILTALMIQVLISGDRVVLSRHLPVNSTIHYQLLLTKHDRRLSFLISS